MAEETKTFETINSAKKRGHRGTWVKDVPMTTIEVNELLGRRGAGLTQEVILQDKNGTKNRVTVLGSDKQFMLQKSDEGKTCDWAVRWTDWDGNLSYEGYPLSDAQDGPSSLRVRDYNKEIVGRIKTHLLTGEISKYGAMGVTPEALRRIRGDLLDFVME